MALPSSGQLTLDQIHVEAGGATGAECTINDTDIRALIGKSAGVQMSFSEWYGASADGIGGDWDGVTGYTVDDNLSTESQVDYAQAVVNFNTNGTWYLRKYDNGAQTDVNYDYTTGAPSSTGSDYEIKWVRVSGSTSIGGSSGFTENTFVSLGTARYLAVTDTQPDGTGIQTVVDITIREAGDAGTEVTNRITLDCDFQDGIAWTSTADTVSSTGISTTNTAGFKLLNDGNSQETNFSGTYVSWTDWSDNPGSTTGSKYEVFWNRISGSFLDSAPTEDTWLDLGISRTWQFNGGGASSRTAIIDVTVRCDGIAASEVTKRVTIQQVYEP